MRALRERRVETRRPGRGAEAADRAPDAASRGGGAPPPGGSFCGSNASPVWRAAGLICWHARHRRATAGVAAINQSEGTLFRLTGQGAAQDNAPSTWPRFAGAFSSAAQADGSGGVSRAAKGADCKSAGLAFVGSSPTSPTINQINRVLEEKAETPPPIRRASQDGWGAAQSSDEVPRGRYVCAYGRAPLLLRSAVVADVRPPTLPNAWPGSYPALSVIVATVTCGQRTLLKIRITSCEY
jgi:hypothetical protein